MCLVNVVPVHPRACSANVLVLSYCKTSSTRRQDINCIVALQCIVRVSQERRQLVLILRYSSCTYSVECSRRTLMHLYGVLNGHMTFVTKTSNQSRRCRAGNTKSAVPVHCCFASSLRLVFETSEARILKSSCFGQCSCFRTRSTIARSIFEQCYVNARTNTTSVAFGRYIVGSLSVQRAVSCCLVRLFHGSVGCQGAHGVSLT